jgi:hypothetical protein
MESLLTDAVEGLDRSRAALRAAVDAVRATLREQAPADGRWSAAGVVEHLALVDERFTGIVAGKIAEARGAGLEREGDRSSQLLPADVASRLADRTERRTAPEPLHPSGLPFDAAWARAEAARAAFRVVLGAADGLALSRVIHEHPRFGRLNAYQWAGFLAAHESRHVEQIREIAAQLDATA